MSFRLGDQMTSIPVSQEVSMNFGNVGDNRGGASFSMNSALPKSGSAFTGPGWNHQESFYRSSSPTPTTAKNTNYAPAPTTATSNYAPAPRYSERQTSPPTSSRPQRKTSSDVSLGDLIDVFVDDKFLKSHNVHYGPAVIHVNGDGESPVGSPSLIGSRASSRATNDGYANHSPSPRYELSSGPFFPASSGRERSGSYTSPTSGSVNSISIGGSPDEYRLSSALPSPSPSPSTKSVSFSPTNKFGTNFTYGAIPQGKTDHHSAERFDRHQPAGTVGAAQVISIGTGGTSSASDGRRTSNGMVSFTSEPETVLTRSDGSPVDKQTARGLRI